MIIKDRYKNRRRMAWLSFACIFSFGLCLLLFGLSTDERAQRVQDLSFLIGSLFGVWTTIVAAYYGVTAAADNAEIHLEPAGRGQPRQTFQGTSTDGPGSLPTK